MQLTEARGEPDLGATAETRTATSEEVRLRDSEWNDGGPESVRYHSLQLDGLTSGTPYAYRVGSDGGWSEWHHFRTADDDPEASFRFLYFGDVQNGILSHWARVLRTAYRAAPDAAFALYAGDLVNDGHADTQWSEWYRAGAWLHATLPAIPVTGNHEYRSLDRAREGDKLLAMLWRPQFGLPVDGGVPEGLAETVYTLDYQTARLFVLNSNRDVESQALWLEEALAAPTERWKIVTFHHPLFSNAGDRDNPGLRDLWLPILERHGVDLVLQGHDHTYSRGSLAPERRTGDGTGPVFVVSVAGAKQYELADEPWSNYAGDAELARAAENTQLYQVITVEPSRLGFRSYTAIGELYDGFELLREDGGKRLVELPPAVGARRFDNTGPYTSGHWTDD